MSPLVALVGNPNAGKTSLFNALTGSNQHVGNWPGKTVEKKEGFCTIAGHEFHIFDLPGTYSLSPFTAEEIITRDFLLEKKPDLTLIVVDAANLERNLYLALQVLEMEIPAILVLNMMDMARGRGIKINITLLSARLGIPIVATVARRREGLTELEEMILETIGEKRPYAN
jgi:ferrous iron transport protein B